MQLLNSVVTTATFLLLLFSLHLFFAKKGNNLLNRLLSLVFFARFGQVLIYMLVSSNHLTIFPFFHKLFTPFYYAAPACFYLYVDGFVNGRRELKKADWLHFIPVLLAIVHVLPWGFSPPVNWDEVAKQISENKQLFLTERNGLFSPHFYYVGRSALMLFYLCASWLVVIKSKILKNKEWELGKLWILFLLSIATFFNLLSFLPLIFGGLHQSLATYSWFVIFNCLMLLFIIIFIFHQPRLLYGYLFVAANWDKEEPTQRSIVALEKVTAIGRLAEAREKEEPDIIPAFKTNLLPDQLSAYTEAMTHFMETEKPFLQPGFQIVHLAQKLDIPVHHCSFVINKVIGKNFRDWINAYRVRSFITHHPLLADRMTIEAIAHKSGFKSVATFYNAFKKETGSMPTAYFEEK